MHEVSIFYKGRMSWLNEIQLFRKDLQRIRCEVKLLESDINEDNITKEKIRSFKESVQTIDKELDITEKSILFSLNNGRNYWVDSFGNSFSSRETIIRDNELFDKMKNNYSSLIDLLKVINNYYLQMDFAI